MRQRTRIGWRGRSGKYVFVWYVGESLEIWIHKLGVLWFRGEGWHFTRTGQIILNPPVIRQVYPDKGFYERGS